VPVQGRPFLTLTHLYQVRCTTTPQWERETFPKIFILTFGFFVITITEISSTIKANNFSVQSSVFSLLPLHLLFFNQNLNYDLFFHHFNLKEKILKAKWMSAGPNVPVFMKIEKMAKFIFPKEVWFR
jgi:hypothetical protein